MLLTTVFYPAFTQTDTTRLVPVKAYKLGYLIRDASLLRVCDSLATQQGKDLKIKADLNASYKREISSLKRENKSLIRKDSAREVNSEATNLLYVMDKEKLKQKKNTWIKVSVSSWGIILLLAAIILL